jgi:hypothetical protein
MKEHPDKHIRAAIDYARREGFFHWRQKRALFWTGAGQPGIGNI